MSPVFPAATVPSPVTEEKLDKAQVLDAFYAAGGGVLKRLEIFPILPSTNQYLLDDFHFPPAVCFAETQTAGRGRQGRAWLSPSAGGIWMSLSYPWQGFPPGSLSLACATAVIGLLRTYGASDIGLKWPNDIIWRERKKLAGFLLETRVQGKNAYLVVGLGMNTALSPGAVEQIPNWTDLSQVLGKAVSRNRLAGDLTACLLAALARFERDGLQDFLPDWRHFDLLEGKEVSLLRGSESICGKVHGVNTEGALLLETAGRLNAYHSGEVHINAW